MASDPALPLAGRCVLVTGASSGIGRAIALAAARHGADVAITYRANASGASDVVEHITAMSRRAAAFQLDLSNDTSVRTVAKQVQTALGRVDVWINNAGADILTGEAAALDTLGRLDRLIAVDLRGTMVASWEAVSLMQQQPAGGVIINMSWDHVISGMPGTNPQLFAAVKGGVLAFSKALARSVAPAIRVNVIAPGWIETSFGEAVDEQTHDAVAESTPLKRWGRPEDVAGAAVYLASPAANFLTGQTIMVGGGLVM
jgi:3-oxoacyl-[acyl-carrier protein] reductase